MQTNIQKWGNSLGIRIPNILIQKLSLHNGSVLDISIKDDQVILKPRKYNLNQMLFKITEINQHDLELEGDNIGLEKW